MKNYPKVMKCIIVTILLGLFIEPLLSQETYFFEPVKNDSIKIYFDKFGELTTSDISEFYRIGKMDTFYFAFNGEVRDYSNKHELLFRGNYKNGKLNGPAKVYRNGLLVEIGNFKDDVRDSIWTYYVNNQVEKKIDFSFNTFKICESYSKKGVSQIKNGICTYKDNICTYKNNVKIHVNGKFKNGRLDGKWSYGAYTEYYNNGKFIKGVDDMFRTEYFDGPKLTLLSYHPSESVNFYCNFFSITKKYDFPDTLFFPKFNGQGNLNTSFFKILKDSILTLYTYDNEGTYFLLDLGISKENKIDYIRLYSPQKNDKSDKITTIINKLGNWEASRCGKKYYPTKLYFPLVIENHSVIIPDYTKISRGEMVNFVIQKFYQH